MAAEAAPVYATPGLQATVRPGVIMTAPGQVRAS